jgi:hypothetical protein
MVAVWTLRELKKENRRRKLWMPLIICDWLLWTAFEDLGREEATYFIILECL